MPTGCLHTSGYHRGTRSRQPPATHVPTGCLYTSGCHRGTRSRQPPATHVPIPLYAQDVQDVEQVHGDINMTHQLPPATHTPPSSTRARPPSRPPIAYVPPSYPYTLLMYSSKTMSSQNRYLIAMYKQFFRISCYLSLNIISMWQLSYSLLHYDLTFQLYTGKIYP